MTEERRDHLSIALVSFAVMVFQITLTRVLSVVVWYHWAFLSISLVMRASAYRRSCSPSCASRSVTGEAC